MLKSLFFPYLLRFLLYILRNFKIKYTGPCIPSWIVRLFGSDFHVIIYKIPKISNYEVAGCEHDAFTYTKCCHVKLYDDCSVDECPSEEICIHCLIPHLHINTKYVIRDFARKDSLFPIPITLVPRSLWEIGSSSLSDKILKRDSLAGDNKFDYLITKWIKKWISSPEIVWLKYLYISWMFVPILIIDVK